MQGFFRFEDDKNKWVPTLRGNDPFDYLSSVPTFGDVGTSKSSLLKPPGMGAGGAPPSGPSGRSPARSTFDKVISGITKGKKVWDRLKGQWVNASEAQPDTSITYDNLDLNAPSGADLMAGNNGVFSPTAGADPYGVIPGPSGADLMAGDNGMLSGTPSGSVLDNAYTSPSGADLMAGNNGMLSDPYNGIDPGIVAASTGATPYVPGAVDNLSDIVSVPADQVAGQLGADSSPGMLSGWAQYAPYLPIGMAAYDTIMNEGPSGADLSGAMSGAMALAGAGPVAALPALGFAGISMLGGKKDDPWVSLSDKGYYHGMEGFRGEDGNYYLGRSGSETLLKYDPEEHQYYYRDEAKTPGWDNSEVASQYPMGGEPAPPHTYVWHPAQIAAHHNSPWVQIGSRTLVPVAELADRFGNAETTDISPLEEQWRAYAEWLKEMNQM